MGHDTSAEGPDGVYRFGAHRKQFEFGELIRSGVRHPAIVSAAGVGKTRILVQTSITLCGINAGLPMMLTEPTYSMVVDILEPAIEESCDFIAQTDADGHLIIKDGSPVMLQRERPIPRQFRAREHAFYFPWCGSTIMCRSGEKPRRLRGPNVAASGMDEGCDQPEEVFTTLQGRTRHPAAKIRVVMVVGTPRGYNWVYERWAEPGGKKRLRNAGLIRATAHDNFIVTTADPEWIASMKDTYDPQLYAQEVMGDFVAIGQESTYYAFARTANLRKGLQFVPRRPVIVCCDFNHSPLAWVILQPGSDQRCERCIDEAKTPATCGEADIHAWRVIGELGSATEGPVTTEEACKELIRRYGQPPLTTYEVYGSVRMTDRNYSDYEIIRDKLKAGAYTTKRTHIVKDRTNSVNGLLRNAAQRTRLLIDEEKCPSLVKDMEQTRYIPGSFDIDGSNEHLTHWGNALSFWAVQKHPVVAGRRGE